MYVFAVKDFILFLFCFSLSSNFSVFLNYESAHCKSKLFNFWQQQPLEPYIDQPWHLVKGKLSTWLWLSSDLPTPSGFNLRKSNQKIFIRRYISSFLFQIDSRRNSSTWVLTHLLHLVRGFLGCPSPLFKTSLDTFKSLSFWNFCFTVSDLFSFVQIIDQISHFRIYQGWLSATPDSLISFCCIALATAFNLRELAFASYLVYHAHSNMVKSFHLHGVAITRLCQQRRSFTK